MLKKNFFYLCPLLFLSPIFQWKGSLPRPRSGGCSSADEESWIKRVEPSTSEKAVNPKLPFGATPIEVVRCRTQNPTTYINNFYQLALWFAAEILFNSTHRWISRMVNFSKLACLPSCSAFLPSMSPPSWRFCTHFPLIQSIALYQLTYFKIALASALRESSLGP